MGVTNSVSNLMVTSHNNMTFIGDNLPCGVYVLLITVLSDLDLKFGRFKKGKVIHLPFSDYLYIGSALGKKGSTSLARRLVRHATRTSDQRPHCIRSQMLEFFLNIQLSKGSLHPNTPKKLFWNIDHLLDCAQVEIIGLVSLRIEAKLEAEIGKQLELRPDTRVVEKGLGANDLRGNTHLLQFFNSKKNWPLLVDSLVQTWSAYCSKCFLPLSSSDKFL